MITINISYYPLSTGTAPSQLNVASSNTTILAPTENGNIPILRMSVHRPCCFVLIKSYPFKLIDYLGGLCVSDHMGLNKNIKIN